MSKQTAVEQLINEMESLLEQPYVNPKNALNDCINLAYNKIQMEKEQIEMACNQQEFEDIDGLGICETISKGEQYYNETYGGTQC
jgi:hypothetical protein